MTDSEPNRDSAPTAEQWDKEMERVVGALRPGRNVQDFATWQTEVRRQYGHHPYSRLRRAVSLLLTQSDEIPAPSLFGMFIREAQRQLLEEARDTAGLLPLDEQRQKAEHNATYAEIYKRVGIGTEPFEWNLCKGMAKGRRGDGKEPSDQEIEEIYQKRRAMDIPVGKWSVPKHFPTWNKEQTDKDDYWTPELPPTP